MYFEMAARDIRGAAEARGHGPRQHRADRQVHGQLLLRPGRDAGGRRAATTTPTTTSCSTRARRAASAKIQFHDSARRSSAFAPAERGDLPRAGRRLPRAARRRRRPTRPSSKDIDFLHGARRAVHAGRLRASWCSRTRPSTRSRTTLVDEIFDVFVRDFSPVRDRAARPRRDDAGAGGSLPRDGAPAGERRGDATSASGPR